MSKINNTIEMAIKRTKVQATKRQETQSNVYEDPIKSIVSYTNYGLLAKCDVMHNQLNPVDHSLTVFIAMISTDCLSLAVGIRWHIISNLRFRTDVSILKQTCSLTNDTRIVNRERLIDYGNIIFNSHVNKHPHQSPNVTHNKTHT